MGLVNLKNCILNVITGLKEFLSVKGGEAMNRYRIIYKLMDQSEEYVFYLFASTKDMAIARSKVLFPDRVVLTVERED